jgi:glyoxylase-like metal-dependent hydrolase (beta-lactamase superfamily II)
MNKTVKKILIGIGILIVLIALVMGGFMLKMKSETKKMNVIQTMEIVNNVYAIDNSYVNMFLLKDSDNYIAIDAGNDKKDVAKELKKLNINPEKVVAVLLTHTDGDHVAAITLFKNAEIFLSRQEEQLINGTTSRLFFRGNKIDAKKYTLLDDRQVFKIGNIEISCILTPGHTPGSMSYLLNNKYLFVGDAFGLDSAKVGKPNDFFSNDMKKAIQSFQKINRLPNVEFIFTAHNGFSADYKNAINTTLE